MLMGQGAAAGAEVTHLTFADLAGWAEDDHAAALAVFTETCGDMRGPDWPPLCALARSATDARAFFETFFIPVLLTDGSEMLFTGYYEPEISGVPYADADHTIPIYRLPEWTDEVWPTRRQIDEGLFAGQGLEIAWVADPVDLFFLQVQGSGRIRFPDGGGVRLGYAGANGHDYVSPGRTLVEKGIFQAHEVSAGTIRDWVRDNPDDGRDLLWLNNSYVFFREVNEVPAERGPLGAMNRSVTPLRTIAVDPAHYPLGAPVWIEKQGADGMQRLMIAQDTGSAIKGAQRADIFYGTGAAAGAAAGNIRDGGRMVVLLPIQEAYARLPGRLARGS